MLHHKRHPGAAGLHHGGHFVAKITPEFEEKSGLRSDAGLTVKSHQRWIKQKSAPFQIVGDVQVEDADLDREGRQLRSGPGIEGPIDVGGHVGTLVDAEGVDKKGVSPIWCGLFQKLVKEGKTGLEPRYTAAGESDRKSLGSAETGVQSGAGEQMMLLHKVRRLLHEVGLETVVADPVERPESAGFKWGAHVSLFVERGA